MKIVFILGKIRLKSYYDLLILGKNNRYIYNKFQICILFSKQTINGLTDRPTDKTSKIIGSLFFFKETLKTKLMFKFLDYG